MTSEENLPGREPAGDPAWDSARRQIDGSTLSIIMPAYRLGATIAGNIRHVHDLFSQHIPFEIVPVDDGSDDNTRKEIAQAASELPEVRPVYMTQNMGKGAALRAGFQASRGTYILLLDGDLDLPPRQVSRFFGIMEEKQADVVIGSKRHEESELDYPWHRRLASAVYYGIVKLLIGLPVRDTQTGIKLYKREVLDWVVPRMLVKRFAFDLELLAIAHEKGYRVAEAPVRLEFRTRLGSLNVHSVREVMNDTLAIFYRTKILRYYQTIRHTEPPSHPPLVSIVIAYPAHTACLEECLQAISRQTYENYEVILLPDNPHSTLDPLGPWGPTGPEDTRHSTRILPTGRIRPAEKRNIGIREAKGDIVAFLDDDAFPVDDWLAHAMVYFTDEAIAAVGGPAVTPPSDPYMAKLSGRVLANRLVSGGYRSRYTPTRVQEVADFPSCNLLVRTEVLRSLGGFRTDFWPGEDTILCMEIVNELGRKIMYDPRVLAFHHRRCLFLPHLRQIGRYALHRGYFARKFPATSRKLSYMLPSLFVLGLVCGAIAAAVLPALRPAYLGAVLLYAVVTLAGAHRLRDPVAWLLAWWGIILTHCVYGIRFLVGLLARRLPDEVQPFDHASENGNSKLETGGKHEGGP